MSQMRALLLMVVLMLFEACATVHQSSPRYYEAQEAAIRQLSSHTEGATVIFVAFGADHSGHFIDPPADFLQRLANLPKPAKPASAGDYFHETLQHGRYSGYRDRITHRRGWLFSITVERSSSPTKIKLDVESAGGILSGGQWIFDATLDSNGHWLVGPPQAGAVF
jgi:hypothetical protein